MILNQNDVETIKQVVSNILKDIYKIDSLCYDLTTDPGCLGGYVLRLLACKNEKDSVNLAYSISPRELELAPSNLGLRIAEKLAAQYKKTTQVAEEYTENAGRAMAMGIDTLRMDALRDSQQSRDAASARARASQNVGRGGPPGNLAGSIIPSVCVERVNSLMYGKSESLKRIENVKAANKVRAEHCKNLTATEIEERGDRANKYFGAKFRRDNEALFAPIIGDTADALKKFNEAVYHQKPPKTKVKIQNGEVDKYYDPNGREIKSKWWRFW